MTPNDPTNTVPPPAATREWGTEDDDDLIQGCIDGHEAAWRTLVERHERLVYSIPRRLGIDAATCEDIFQEVFSILVRQLPGLRNRTGLPKWLITTTTRVSRQHRARTVGKGVDHDFLDVHLDPLETALRWEQLTSLRMALDQLGGKCRALLLSLYGGGTRPKYENVAAALGIPVGSIGPTRARCLRSLLDMLDPSGADSGKSDVSGEPERPHVSSRSHPDA